MYEIITLDSRPDFLPLEKFNQRRSSSCLFDETPNIPRPNEQTQYRIDETRYKKKKKGKEKKREWNEKESRFVSRSNETTTSRRSFYVRLRVQEWEKNVFARATKFHKKAARANRTIIITKPT